MKSGCKVSVSHISIRTEGLEEVVMLAALFGNISYDELAAREPNFASMVRRDTYDAAIGKIIVFASDLGVVDKENLKLHPNGSAVSPAILEKHQANGHSLH